MVSVIEEHTRCVSNAPAELDVPVCIVEARHQLLLGCEIDWTAGDTDMAEALVRACLAAHPAVKSAINN